MKEVTVKNRRGYQLMFRKNFELITDYFPDYKSDYDAFDYSVEELPSIDQVDEFAIKFVISVEKTVSYYSTALSLSKKGQNFSIFIKKDFEDFIAELLVTKGWSVLQDTKPQAGSINIISTKVIDDMGLMRCVWITKKYAPHRFVGVKIVRELCCLISEVKASKGVIVTTSRLTKGAVKLIEENRFKMSYIDHEMLKTDLLQYSDCVLTDELPF